MQRLSGIQLLFIKGVGIHKTKREKLEIGPGFHFKVIPGEGTGKRSPESVNSSITHGKILFDSNLKQAAISLRHTQPNIMLPAIGNFFFNQFFQRAYFLSQQRMAIATLPGWMNSHSISLGMVSNKI